MRMERGKERVNRDDLYKCMDNVQLYCKYHKQLK